MAALTPGTPCWIDINSSDVPAAARFYAAVLGWDVDVSDDPQYGGYGTFSAFGHPVAGISPCQEDNPYRDIWTVYLATADVEATCAAAESAGAMVAMPPMTVGDQGRMAMLADPAGAVIALWQADQHAGFDRSERPGTPVWFESMSRDYAAALPFYVRTFGVGHQVQADTDEFRYSVLTCADAQGEVQELAGIMDASAFLPDGVPSHWQVYFDAPDVDAAVSAVLANGGAVIEPVSDSPYGRLATVADPMGSQFRIITRPE